MSASRQMLNKGRGPAEAVEAKPTKEFDAKMGNRDEFVRRAFESLWGYLSPDAIGSIRAKCTHARMNSRRSTVVLLAGRADACWRCRASSPRRR